MRGNYSNLSQWRKTAIWVSRAVLLTILAISTTSSWGAEERAVKSRVAPIYPEVAKRLKIAGEVVVKATVEPDGRVSDVKTVAGSRMLSMAAEDAVRKWKFVAAPSVSIVDVSVNFALTQ